MDLLPRKLRGLLAIGLLGAARSSHAQGPSPALATGEHDVVVNGVRLWYRVAGAATPGTPPVLFLHGGPGYNSYTFD